MAALFARWLAAAGTRWSRWCGSFEVSVVTKGARGISAAAEASELA